MTSASLTSAPVAMRAAASGRCASRLLTLHRGVRELHHASESRTRLSAPARKAQGFRQCAVPGVDKRTRPRLRSIKAALAPFPAPGAPFKKMSSRGACKPARPRRFSIRRHAPRNRAAAFKSASAGKTGAGAARLAPPGRGGDRSVAASSLRESGEQTCRRRWPSKRAASASLRAALIRRVQSKGKQQALRHTFIQVDRGGCSRTHHFQARPGSRPKRRACSRHAPCGCC